jgi:hypothetical protein
LDDEKVPGAPMVAANARSSRFGLASSDPRGNAQFQETIRKQECSILYSVGAPFNVSLSGPNAKHGACGPGATKTRAGLGKD